ncbi:hypothetical protein [Herpetosiphon llansteffanensis]|uniref:hypothetical protein n=1 Tax=Herpetosiphon llansteffanensis TaxID=2094568 RepID=UPI000D7C743A|nr:hypothetical protein [Herpetosiphon llansteffanensis]
MNYIQLYEKVWIAAITIYKSDPIAAQMKGVSVTSIAQYILEEGQYITKDIEDAVRYAMEDLKSNHVVSPPPITTSNRDRYILKRSGLNFFAYRDTLHIYFKCITVSPLGVQMLIVIADRTKDFLSDLNTHMCLDDEDLYCNVGIDDFALIDIELNRLKNNKLITALQTKDNWSNIRITYAGLIWLDKNKTLYFPQE